MKNQAQFTEDNKSNRALFCEFGVFHCLDWLPSKGKGSKCTLQFNSQVGGEEIGS